MIKQCKVDPTIPVSSQEASTSSKTVSLAHFYSCLGTENWHTDQDLHLLVIHDDKDDAKVNQILKISRQGPPGASKYDCVLDTVLLMIGSQKSANNSRFTN